MIGKTISHYKILEKLGEGGMGIVYKAEDTKLKREVALKFLPTNALQGEAEKERFLREAQAAAALNHANIAHIYAVDEVDNQAFIAMEFIEGQSLADMVASPVTLDKAIDYATQIAAGLQAAHEKGITHRDIKSANIMVTAKSQIKIMDFGLAIHDLPEVQVFFRLGQNAMNIRVRQKGPDLVENGCRAIRAFMP